jgi:hypothetical protein
MAQGGKRKGAGRKRVPVEVKRMPIAMRVSPACNEWIREQAEKYELSLGEMVEQMMYVWRDFESKYNEEKQTLQELQIEHISQKGKDLFRLRKKDGC